MLTDLLTSCTSSPKWKCGTSVCCVRCTSIKPSSISGAAPAPCCSIASGARSRIATDNMNPADNATSFSSVGTLHRDRDATAAAPAIFAAAARRVYATASRLTNASVKAGQQRLPRQPIMWARARGPSRVHAMSGQQVPHAPRVQDPEGDNTSDRIARRDKAPAAASR